MTRYMSTVNPSVQSTGGCTQLNRHLASYEAAQKLEFWDIRYGVVSPQMYIKSPPFVRLNWCKEYKLKGDVLLCTVAH